MPEPAAGWLGAWIARGSPWCDTCGEPAVYSEVHGIVHATPEFPFGLPQHLDPARHEVTFREWYRQ